MKINVLGTSCSWFKRKNTSFIIDDEIVFDMPTGSFKEIIKNINLFDTKCIFITHFHSDHFADLHHIVTQACRHPERMADRLKVYGPKTILERLIELNKLCDGDEKECSIDETKKYVDFIELYDGMTFNIGKYKVKAYLMSHRNAETYGFTFEDENGVVVGFSADTCYCENLEKIVKNSNFALVEMCRTTVGDNHLSINEFESLAKKYPACKLFPVHTSDECQEYAKRNGMNYLEDGQVLELK